MRTVGEDSFNYPVCLLFLMCLMVGLTASRSYGADAAQVPHLTKNIVRIVWTFREGEVCESTNKELSAILFGIDLEKGPEPVFMQRNRSDESLLFDGLSSSLPPLLTSYCHVYVRGNDQAVVLLNRLAEKDEIIAEPFAEFLPRVPELTGHVHPPKAPEQFFPSDCERDVTSSGPTRSLRHCQHYLDEADAFYRKYSIDAEFAWGIEGGCGDGVTLVHFDEGWSVHEDIPLGAEMITALGTNFHGTAALGVIAGKHDGLGISGISPKTMVIPKSFDAFALGELPNLGAMIRAEADSIVASGRAGVILLELQTNQLLDFNIFSDLLPVEVSPDVRSAIDYATGLGIYVVEAAGNGEKNLEIFGLNEGTAIMVGAGNPETLDISLTTNRGKRVNVGGWGFGIATAGGFGDDTYCSLQCRDSKSDECYTISFGGTSGAAAMVAGMVASLAGVARAHGVHISRDQMVNLLRTSDLRWNEDSVGPMPNLKQALKELEKSVPGGLRPIAGANGVCQ